MFPLPYNVMLYFEVHVHVHVGNVATVVLWML